MHPKRIIISAVLLLVIIIGFSAYSRNMLAKTSDKLQAHINKVESGAKSGNWDDTSEAISEMRQDWEKTSKYWTMLLDHIEIDNIDISLTRLDKFIEAEDASQSMAEAAALKQYIKHIPEKESFNLKNLF